MRWFYTAAFLIVAATVAADMWADPPYRLMGDIALIGVTVLISVFTLLYWTRSRWWANRIGKVYLIKSIVFTLVLAQGSLSVWWAVDYPGSDHIRFAIYALGVAVCIPMLVHLWREQQRDRKPRQDELRR